MELALLSLINRWNNYIYRSAFGKLYVGTVRRNHWVLSCQVFGRCQVVWEQGHICDSTGIAGTPVSSFLSACKVQVAADSSSGLNWRPLVLGRRPYPSLNIWVRRKRKGARASPVLMLDSVYLCMHMSTHISAYMCNCVGICVFCIHVCLWTCMCMWPYICVCMYILHLCVHVIIELMWYVYLCECVYMWIQMSICVFVHICICIYVDLCVSVWMMEYFRNILICYLALIFR